MHEFGLKGDIIACPKAELQATQQHCHSFAAGSAESLGRLQKVTSAESFSRAYL